MKKDSAYYRWEQIKKEKNRRYTQKQKMEDMYKLKLISKLEKVNKEIHDKNLFPKDYLLDVIKHIAGFDKDINN